ncbi:uncharacterized protein LOC123865066 isoform X2 [Maniola jurtina]|uniref:uncharacterized protein LOC123865066 isoform X2 n=1 Tax=Maniola jurtina TaxID=191418 RepID=UPI001E68FA5B|nr:uncharacterized protein LOC123865066 isoform X2 [Maniola jurtina]
MTSPIVLVLYLALVWSSIGVVSEQTADNNSTKQKIMQSITETVEELVKEDNIYDKNTRISNRTNVVSDKKNLTDYILKYETNGDKENEIAIDSVKNYDEIYTEKNNILDRLIDINSDKVSKLRNSNSSLQDFIKEKRVKREEKVSKCDSFTYEKGKKFLSHPHIGDNDNVNYSSSTYCTTVIRGPEGNVVQLSFIDMFHIEEHPECDNDYLEIRDGDKGYYNLLGKLCGEDFPSQITTTGPYAWLKFYSDDTIEYEGFRIQIDFIPKDTSYSVPETCVTHLQGKYGRIDSNDTNKACDAETEDEALDYLWSIDVPVGYKIYLNFTNYTVGEPNECDQNFVQVFGKVLEFDEKLAHFCGSVATSVATTGPEPGGATEGDDDGHIMHVRLYAAKEQREKTYIDATFTAYRMLDLSKNNTCDAETEFDCQDSTCIDISLRCDNYANCRLKADEEKDLCMHTTESLMQQTSIQAIVSVFCVILSGIIFVFLYKCIMKLYNDHKIIKEQMSKSCEDKLDSMFGSQLLLDAKRMQSDIGPRASLERDNETNEMFKQQRKLQQKIRPSSIDSDFIPELNPDFEEEVWREKVNGVSKTEDEIKTHHRKTRRKEFHEIEGIIIESDEKTRRKEDKDEEDVKKERKEKKRIKVKQENLRKKEDLIKKKEGEERNQISEAREMSVSVPDTKQSGCQTRESLFETDPVISSNGSGSAHIRSLNKFGYSSPSAARPSPPQIKPSEIIIEVIRPNIEQERKTQKKILADRRPMSAETTRSAPDVIILAKPAP